MSDWPVCQHCGYTILRHRLYGMYAYCGLEGRADRGTFTVTQINEVRRTLGQKPSQKALDKEKEERKELEGQEKMELT